MELAELRRRDNLPHLYGRKWYPWAWKFFCSRDRFAFLVAANQISKSSSLIRKIIHLATAQELWPEIWPHNKPSQFWYFYPLKSVATNEFHEKWVPEWLPRGEMKKDPIYGWEPEYRQKDIYAIHFNSGVSIYFKSYEQDAQSLQSGSVAFIAADEEMPFELFHEIRSRITAIEGAMFNMVFTATLGQEEWRRTMEPTTKSEELFPNALKLQVSMYDCLTYIDGSKSHWTIERIKEIENECATEQERQRRVFGRFVVSQGLMYPSFNRGHNVIKPFRVPSNYLIYTGVDIGTGGENNHPAAIVFIAVRPDFQYAIVFKCWRGDGIVTTTADIVEQYQKMLCYDVPSTDGTLVTKKYTPVLQTYDWNSKDFFTFATKAGLAFTPADKARESGQSLLNTLFKLKMLVIMDYDVETGKLINELTTLNESTVKRSAKDDLIDALRYAAKMIPWDFQSVAKIISPEETQTEEFHDDRSEAQKHFDDRRAGPMPKEEAWSSIEDELSFWQDLIE